MTPVCCSSPIREPSAFVPLLLLALAATGLVVWLEWGVR